MTPWPCSCGAPGVRNVGTHGYCSACLGALFATFDPQRARDEAAGPPVGRVRPLATPIAPKTSIAEPKPERFSTDAVASMLGGVA